MFTKTSAISKNTFFKSVTTDGPKSYQERALHLNKSAVTLSFSYDKPVYLTAKTGIAMVILSDRPQGPFEEFMLHGSIKLNPNIYFNLISISDKCQVCLKTAPQSQVTHHHLDEPLVWRPIEPQIQISEIFTFYYQVKKAPYHFSTERHSYCELTIVEHGELETTVDGTNYRLKKNDAMLYQSQQPHSQSVFVDETTSYITILFDMKLMDPQFFNRVFHLNANQLSQLESFIRISEDDSCLYKNDQLLARLKLFILSLISEAQTSATTSSSMKDKYDQDICQKITTYIKEHPEVRVIDLSRAFGMSRSNLQTLFHRFMNMPPHAYIEEQRLKQAKILMRDSSYSLTEIARKIGYHSLPAFSRSFKHAFGYPPSSYAKKLYKQV